MTPHLLIVPIDPMDGDLLEEIAQGIESRCPFAVAIRSAPLDPASAWSEERGQHHSTTLLSRLDEQVHPRTERVLGVGDLDLFIPILTYVFGEARLGGRTAVLGLKRLRPESYGLPPDPTLLRERAVKEAVHEIGHTLSLVHCPDHSCVMASSATADAVDTKGARFCSGCRARALASARSR